MQSKLTMLISKIIETIESRNLSNGINIYTREVDESTGEREIFSDKNCMINSFLDEFNSEMISELEKELLLTYQETDVNVIHTTKYNVFIFKALPFSGWNITFKKI